MKYSLTADAFPSLNSLTIYRSESKHLKSFVHIIFQSGADGNLLLIAAIAGVLGLLCCCLILFLCCRRRRKKKQPKEKISDMVMAEGQIIDVIDSNPSIELGKVSGLNLTTDSQGSNPVRSGMFQVGETKIVTSGPMI